MIDIDAIVESISTTEQARLPTRAGRQWTAEEDSFLRANLGYLTDEEIGIALNRTDKSVHIRWTRSLALPAPSKAPEILTAHQASLILGSLESRTIAYYVEVGFIPGRIMANTGRRIRLIDRRAFRAWVVNPMNWIYFDWKKITDPGLRRLCELRAERWGDEWWTTRQVADFHGIATGDIKRYIHLGKLPARQSEYPLEGRARDRKWKAWFVLKSDAVKMHYLERDEVHWRFTPRARAAIVRMRDEQGMQFKEIARRMKCAHETIKRHYLIAKKEELSMTTHYYYTPAEICSGGADHVAVIADQVPLEELQAGLDYAQRHPACSKKLIKTLKAEIQKKRIAAASAVIRS